MKSFFVLGSLALILLSSCNNNKPEEKSVEAKDSLPLLDTFSIGNKFFSVYPSTKEDFDKFPAPPTFDSLEKNNLLRDSAEAFRLGSVLVLNCGKHETMSFKNDTTEGYDTYADYTYRGKIAEINQFLILGAFMESFSYWLINPVSGDTTHLCGEPVFSPDKKYFICGNTDLIAGFVLNGFDMYEVNNKQIKAVGQQYIDKWGPEKIKWLDNASLLVQRNILDTTISTMIRTDYVKMNMK